MGAGLSHLSHFNTTQDLGTYEHTEEMRQLEFSGSTWKVIEAQVKDSGLSWICYQL